MTAPVVALVLVSHSRALAAGVAELVGEMAPDVTVAVAGGRDGEEGLGTDLDFVSAALAHALDAAEQVVLLYDLGSARMTADIAVEMQEGASARVVDAPLVEGALAAAVAAQGGADADGVARAAREAGALPQQTPTEASAPQQTPTGGPGGPPGADPGGPPGAGADVPLVERRVVLVNPLGLHARPAARVATLARQLGGALLARGDGGPAVDASSVLAIVGLAVRGDDEVVLRTADDAAADRLVELLSSGFGEQDEGAVGSRRGTGSAGTDGSPVATGPTDTGSTGGTSGSPGLAVGPVVLLEEAGPPPRRAPTGTTQQERTRSGDAATSAAERLREGGDLGEVHAQVLDDADLRVRVEQGLQGGQDAATAWWRAGEAVAARFAAADDRLVAERAADIRDAVHAVLQELGVVGGPPSGPHLAGAVVVAPDVLPSWVAPLAGSGVVALVLGRSGPTSHATVVARGIGLPAVVGRGDLSDLMPGRTVVVDGSSGHVDAHPDDKAVTRARQAVQTAQQEAVRRRDRAREPVVVHGRSVPVLANVASADEARRAREEGADGIGLLRTELLLTDRPDLPSEDEQIAALVAICREVPGRRVVVRTFDVGGDKPVPALRLDPVAHGFLGERGLRYGLTHRPLLDTQLRAVVRAAAEVAGEGTQVAVMAPMVTVAAEVQSFREALHDAVERARADGHAAESPSAVGIMVEVPAAALAVETLAPLVDFVSVGTNDLVQYVLAAERTTAQVRHLYQPEHPAVARVLRLLVDGAHAAGCEVAVCGQMAAEPATARWLVTELRVDELSVPAAAVGQIKDVLRVEG